MNKKWSVLGNMLAVLVLILIIAADIRSLLPDGRTHSGFRHTFKSEKVEVRDSRDPEVVKARGLVEGTRSYTLVYMRSVEQKLRVWLAKRPNAELEKKINTYSARLNEIEVYESGLVKDKELGVTIKPESVKILKLNNMIKKATDGMFEILTEIQKVKN